MGETDQAEALFSEAADLKERLAPQVTIRNLAVDDDRVSIALRRGDDGGRPRPAHMPARQRGRRHGQVRAAQQGIRSQYAGRQFSTEFG
jgi:hypothetical protein